ncbi:MAG TPA: cupredoxin domain-containing protein [Aquihabitans sp.]|nr:cupredoxin domain-containing protein [Aquihabitans sp.]
MNARSRCAALAVIVAVGLTGCSDDSDTASDRSTTTRAETTTTSAALSSSTSSAPTTTAEGGDQSSSPEAVEIVDFTFEPTPLEVEAGTTITFTNGDEVPHTATSTDAPSSFDTGELAGGSSGEITVDEPGTYRYQCGIHPDMQGEIEAR